MFLKVEEVHFKYMQGTPFEVHAIKGLSFSIERGEFVGLIGSSGAGKTTMIQLLTGLIRPTAGTILIDGISTSKNISLNKLRKRIGIVFQNPEQQLFADNVYQDVSFGPRNLGLGEDEIEKRVDEALRQVCLDPSDIKGQSPFSLSGGEMRRVALAGIIAMQPDALILDEPTAGLDPGGREAFLGYIENLHKEKGMTIIIVSHRMEDMACYAKRLLVLHQGLLVLQGDRSKVFSSESNLKDYGLNLPPVTQLMENLKARGKNVRTDIFTVDDACSEIKRYFQSGTG